MHRVTCIALVGAVACAKQTALPRLPEESPSTPEEPTQCRVPEKGTWSVGLTLEYPELTFEAPVDVVWAPHDVTRSYVVEYTGLVRRVDHAAATDTPTFLDVRRHLERHTGEVGLWDIAFHPSYPDVPHVYAFLSGNGGETDFRSMLLRYSTADGGETVDVETETLLLEIERPQGGLHGGGKIGFGADGMLWISTGDGGAFGDPEHTSQARDSLLGKFLRIDVDGAVPYGIPADNPFALGGGAPEVYALGFRNPWRWSFDMATGDVWVGDVGHYAVEEIDRVVAGGNYGWNVREGSHCFEASSCASEFIEPEFEYGRDQGSCVTGGYVYRGTAIPELVGRYVFGDFTSGRIWTLSNGQRELLINAGLAIGAFAQRPDGELLVLDLAYGRIYRLTPTDMPAPGVPERVLSATGCLEEPRFIPYDVNMPLWSDHLSKDREIFIPPGTVIEGQPDGQWAFRMARSCARRSPSTACPTRRGS